MRASLSTGADLAWVAFYVGGHEAALSGDWEYPISVLKTWGVAQVDALVPVAVGATGSIKACFLNCCKACFKNWLSSTVFPLANYCSEDIEHVAYWLMKWVEWL